MTNEENEKLCNIIENTKKKISKLNSKLFNTKVNLERLTNKETLKNEKQRLIDIQKQQIHKQLITNILYFAILLGLYTAMCILLNYISEFSITLKFIAVFGVEMLMVINMCDFSTKKKKIKCNIQEIENEYSDEYINKLIEKEKSKEIKLNNKLDKNKLKLKLLEKYLNNNKEKNDILNTYSTEQEISFQKQLKN